jgi:hypothetical protein
MLLEQIPAIVRLDVITALVYARALANPVRNICFFHPFLCVPGLSYRADANVKSYTTRHSVVKPVQRQYLGASLANTLLHRLSTRQGQSLVNGCH